MHIKELKQLKPNELLEKAEQMNIENPASLRKQEQIYAILKSEAERGKPIYGEGVLEVLNDGFGFLRSVESNYLARKKDQN